MLTLKIPLRFIESKLGRPTWADVLFGMENQLINPRAISQLAEADLGSADPAPEVVELAIAGPGGHVLQEVTKLAARESPAPTASTTVQRWLYLVLAWLYEHRADLADPLQSVEIVYADFNYPEEVGQFVRYLPSDDPDLGDREANESRLIDKWEEYLHQARATLTA